MLTLVGCSALLIRCSEGLAHGSEWVFGTEVAEETLVAVCVLRAGLLRFPSSALAFLALHGDTLHAERTVPSCKEVLEECLRVPAECLGPLLVKLAVFKSLTEVTTAIEVLSSLVNPGKLFADELELAGYSAFKLIGL